jgi:microcystin-dependent protein
MPRPVVYPVVFATLSGNVSASTIDQDFNASGSAINDSASGWVNAALDTGSTNSYIVTLNPPATQYSNGFYLAMLPLNQNTGPSSINVNGLGNIPILKADGSALTPQSMVPGTIYEMVVINSAFRIISPNVSPLVGQIEMFGGGANIPANWLQCNGAAVSRTTYIALFGVIGTTFGVGDGSTTFNVPNFTGGAFPAGGIPGSTGGGTATLSVANLPAHSHAVAVGDPGHAHTVNAFTQTIQGLQAGGSSYFLPGTVVTSVNQANISVTIGNTGSGTPITVIPKFVGVTFIIRAY